MARTPIADLPDDRYDEYAQLFREMSSQNPNKTPESLAPSQVEVDAQVLRDHMLNITTQDDGPKIMTEDERGKAFSDHMANLQDDDDLPFEPDLPQAPRPRHSVLEGLMQNKLIAEITGRTAEQVRSDARAALYQMKPLAPSDLPALPRFDSKPALSTVETTDVSKTRLGVETKYPLGSLVKINASGSEAYMLGMGNNERGNFVRLLAVSKTGFPELKEATITDLIDFNQNSKPIKEPGRGMHNALSQRLFDLDSNAISEDSEYIQWRFPQGHEVQLFDGQTGVIYDHVKEEGKNIVRVFNNETKHLETLNAKELYALNPKMEDVSAHLVASKKDMDALAPNSYRKLEERLAGRKAIRIPDPAGKNPKGKLVFLLNLGHSDEHPGGYARIFYTENGKRVYQDVSAYDVLSYNPDTKNKLPEIEGGLEELREVQAYFKGMRKIRIPYPDRRSIETIEARRLGIKLMDGEVYVNVVYRDPNSGRSEFKRLLARDLMSYNPKNQSSDAEVKSAANSDSGYRQEQEAA